eukprot:TRINITY_DN6821_c0_g1_i1.p1 TRINITY_DN6821_c0_g1~~TRINITY_DN6821_c0_g1_i1.p1  ORF type:complete len:384 (+),score=118.22 TRINITY_DN6821_c0_g1_i1:97-1248(+)
MSGSSSQSREARLRYLQTERMVLAPILSSKGTPQQRQGPAAQQSAASGEASELAAAEETLLIIKPDASQHSSSILAAMERAGFMTEATTLSLSAEMAQVLMASDMVGREDESYALGEEGTPVEEAAEAEHVPPQRRMEPWQCAGSTVQAMVLSRIGAVAALRQLCGPRDPAQARSVAPGSLRALYGKSVSENAVYCSPTWERAQLDVQAVFGYLPRARQFRSGADDRTTSSDEEELTAAEVEQQRNRLRAERQQLARERRRVMRGHERLAQREAELERRLYPSGYTGGNDLCKLAARTFSVCAVPLTAEEHRRLFDDLDVGNRGWILKQDFARLYEEAPGFYLPGVPGDGRRLQQELATFCAVGEDKLCFDEFSILLYRLARR